MSRKPSSLTALLAPARAPIAHGSVLSVAASLIWLAQAWVIAGALAGWLQGSGNPGRDALLFLALAALRAGLNHAAERQLFRASDLAVARVRERLLGREAKASGSGAFGGPGAVAALAVEKLDALRAYLMRYHPAMTRTALIPPVIFAIAAWHSWAIALVLLLAGPLIPVFMALVGWAAKDASARQMVEIGTLGDLMVDRVAALPDIRLLDAGDRVTGHFAQVSDDLHRRTMAVLRVAFLSSTVLELFAALGVAMVAVWVGFSLLDVIGWGTWGAPLTPFAGIYLLLLAPDFFQPMRDLAAAWHDRAAAQAVADEVQDWQAAPLPALLGEGARATRLAGAPVITWSGLEARGVSYPDTRIEPGARLAVTGRSGAGKSTLLSLLAGLEQPETGQIHVCGQPLDERNADGWRARLGWMPQSPQFPEQPLRAIITEGTPDPVHLHAAALDTVLARLPEGLDTIPGESGAGLSGGEARRVLLARLLHAHPDVVLADEPTADLDPDTADRVTEALLALAAQGATLIVATHDARLIACMDAEVAL
ncbi:ATP-binding cassette domain-containing protein [Rhodobacter sp. NTK016B]|uniref:ABC transporter ATP-binding protein/permease n=1 Tax=Rhodobacter sp. NTK016B TaxID=2759676 RepID=UPI001A8C57F4|nr:ATP-binding cassette domain-containing protein [Rhodobacter sp. NTK016B]MBN8294492.1 ATP-binding cassette domain-containing protein [Rhodobacter sp. NTK016B]